MKWARRRKKRGNNSRTRRSSEFVGADAKLGPFTIGSQAQAQGFLGGAMGINDDQASAPDTSDDEGDGPATPDNESPDTGTTPDGKDKDNGKGEEGDGDNTDDYWDFFI